MALLLVPVFEEVYFVLADFETAFVFLLDDRILVLLDVLFEVVLFECDAFALLFGLLSGVLGRGSRTFIACALLLFRSLLGFLSGGFLLGFDLLCGARIGHAVLHTFSRLKGLAVYFELRFPTSLRFLCSAYKQCCIVFQSAQIHFEHPLWDLCIKVDVDIERVVGKVFDDARYVVVKIICRLARV